jgi:hypothetical protein
MGLKTIKNAIGTYLESISGREFKIRKVYKYFEPTPSEFPCVLVYLKQFDEERLDFQDNKLNSDFIIKLCIPQESDADNEDIEDLRLDCIDAVLDRLRASDAIETLGGETFSTEISSGEPYMDNEAEFPMIVTDITISTSASKLIVSP